MNIPEGSTDGDIESGAGRRKSPTRDELRAWRTFTETTDLVKRRIEAELQQAGVSSGDYAVLLALFEQQGRRMRSSPLAARIGWERSRLSHHLGRMERRALITREQASDDSRGAWVVLTDEGAQTFRRVSSPHLHSVQQMFVSALSSEQLAALDDAMRALAAHLDEAPPPVQQDDSTTLRLEADDTPGAPRNDL